MLVPDCQRLKNLYKGEKTTSLQASYQPRFVYTVSQSLSCQIPLNASLSVKHKPVHPLRRSHVKGTFLMDLHFCPPFSNNKYLI